MKYENGLETRALILVQAKKLFFRKGFKETSIREIANNAHISSGALYKHFNSKEEILDVIVEPCVKEWWLECDKMLKEFEEKLSTIKTRADIKALVMSENDFTWLYAYIKSNSDIWKFILFKSEGTKYQNFFEEFIQWEFEITRKVLNTVDKEKKYLDIISDTELYFLLKGFYQMMLSVFDDKFDDAMRMNYFNILSGIYEPFWEDVFVKIM